QRAAFSGGRVEVTGALRAQAHFNEIHADLPSFMAGNPDVVLIATKTSGLSRLLEEIREVAPSNHAVFVSCQNGLDVEDQIFKAFGRDRGLRLVLNLGCRFKSPREIVSTFAYTNYLSLKDVQGGPTLARAISVDLSASGFRVVLRSDYRAEVFRKVILNAALSPVCALSGVSMKVAMEDPYLAATVRALLREGIAVAKAADVDLPKDFYDRAVDYLAQGGDHKPSMLLDIERGRQTENEDHGGRICRYGREHGVPVPVTETIYHLVRSLENRQLKRDQAEKRKA
ncbi:MAG: ketopantoate reductase C-terminal domain-containing protein, partial [Bdellovibrionota bacterium]